MPSRGKGRSKVARSATGADFAEAQRWASGQDPALDLHKAANKKEYARDQLDAINRIVKRATGGQVSVEAYAPSLMAGGLPTGEGVRSNRPQLPLMDQIHAFTYHTKFDEKRLPQDVISAMRAYRMKLKVAEKFIIDDDAVRFVCDMTQDRPNMNAHAVLARLPFDVMYFELNMHAKVLHFQKLGRLRGGAAELDQVSPVAGYLLYRDGESGARWICHEFKLVPRLKEHDKTLRELGLLRKEDMLESTRTRVMPGILSFVFDPEAEAHDPVRGSRIWRSPTLSLIPDFPRIPARARFPNDDGEARDTDVDVDAEFVIAGDLEVKNGGIVVQDWFKSRGAVIVDPFWRALLKDRPAHQNNRVYAMECLEQSGIMRWLITFLASINAVPREIKRAQTTQGRKQVGANILPYFQHRTISLKLPRDNRVQWARKFIKVAYKNQPRPYHEVRGHWRIVEPGKAKALGRRPGQSFCRHQPEMAEDGLAMCPKCQMIIRWIPHHHRGDPQVGIVDHTYRVSA